jgi:phenylpropionate dioxygenase-like ring-hydroxylating dioxygenase large terminal subunit
MTLLTGGNDPTKFDPAEVWYPVHYINDLSKTQPTAFTLLDRDLVIWWDIHSQDWRVFNDMCPHRLARLSEGRIAEDGLLECPYHGWAFTGAGTCDRIPQQLPDAKAETSRRACVDSLPTAVRQGLLFVYPGVAENAANVKIPIVPAIEEFDRNGWVVLNTFRDLPYDASTLLENVLDPSHLPYTHHGSVGKRENASPVELAIVDSDRSGFTGTWAEGPRRGKLGRQDTTFIAPNLMWHDITSKQFGRTLTVVYATPIRKGECRVFARFPFKFASKIPATLIKLTPTWLNHINNNAILEDDQIFLHYQERYLDNLGGSDRLAQAFYLPTKADLFVFEYRQWWSNYGADPFPGQVLPLAIDRDRLLERYHSHTKHCTSCSRAHRICRSVRQFSIIIAIASWLLSTIAIVLNLSATITISAGSIVPLCALAWWLATRTLDRLEIGQETPARNR